MSLKLSLELSETFDLPCDYDKAFDFFNDVIKTAACLPRVESVKDLGGGKFHWVMEKEGVGKYTIQVEYGAQYKFDREKGRVEWSPVQGIGNGISKGRSIITKVGDKAKVDFATTMDIELPLPGLAKPIIKPFVNREFQKTMEQFKANVIKALT